MQRRSANIFANIDWLTVLIYLFLVTVGWMNIYAAVYNPSHQNIMDFSQKYGKQLIWIVTGFLLALIILIIDAEFFPAFAYPLYGITILVLIAVIFFGTTISGSKSWFRIGSVGIQPAEFAKFVVSLTLAKYLSQMDTKMTKLSTKLISIGIIVLPMLMILLENETGVALVYTAFIFVLYREGLSGNILLLGFLVALLFILALLVDKLVLIGILAGIAFLLMLVIRKNRKNILIISGVFIMAAGAVLATNYAFNHLEAHQKKRIDVFLGKKVDKNRAGYNVNQAKIAIGSGGFTGKGFLEGTQTKYDFVPEQATDFIFCTVGEEWGFLGSALIVIVFIGLIVRIIFLAERQRSLFSRIYGYGVASIFFFHVTVNIGMTIGLAPVIGIPLPFFSYGGSSLWSFTIMLFIFLKLDSNRLQILR